VCSFPIPRSPALPPKSGGNKGRPSPGPLPPLLGRGRGSTPCHDVSVSTHTPTKKLVFFGQGGGAANFLFFGTATPHTHAQGLRGPGHLLP
jgi:hypothetical protein